MQPCLGAADDTRRGSCARRAGQQVVRSDRPAALAPDPAAIRPCYEFSASYNFKARLDQGVVAPNRRSTVRRRACGVYTCLVDSCRQDRQPVGSSLLALAGATYLSEAV